MSEDIRVLKVASCPSLSSRSTLTYQIGCKGEEVFLSLQGNSSGGMFSDEWIRLDLFELTKDESISARSIHKHYQGKSINSAGFMMAVLKDLGLIQPLEVKSRTYKRCNPAQFKVAMQALMEAEVMPETQEEPNPISLRKKGRKTHE
ncbi:hypothetical protein [Desulfobulbus sp.]|uniref:hypothetical protein n=1 Tax=Desulfobulbus sp. TaxID=895 RepID=UPI0027BAE3C7|nr:hypothetical protein [Desulfobulbus sp.]